MVIFLNYYKILLMIKYLGLFILTISAMLLPVEKSSIIADINVSNKNLTAINLNFELTKEIKKSAQVRSFYKEFDKNEEIVSDYSEKEPIKFIEVEKKIVLKSISKEERLITQKVSITKTDITELSYDEIKEQSFQLKAKEISSNNQFAFNLRNYNKVYEDRISTAVAANEKSNSKNRKNDEVENPNYQVNRSEDELVFFDYTEDGKVNIVDTKITSKSTHPTKVGKKVVTQVTQLKTTQLKATIQDMDIFDLDKAKRKVKKSKKVAKTSDQSKGRTPSTDLEKELNGFNDQNGFVYDQKNNNSNRCLKVTKPQIIKSDYSVSLIGIDYSQAEYSKVHNFDLEFNDDGERLSDKGTGEVRLKYKLASNMNIRRGTFFNSSIYPLTMDFVFDGGKQNITIPALTRDSFGSIVQELAVTGEGGHLLVQLDELTEDIDLDINTKYQAKVFLDNNLEIVNRADSDYSYILFVGVDLGNTVAMFKNTKNEISSKIIHITEDEILFDPNFYAEILGDEIAFYQENLTTECKSIMNVSKNKIKPWSFESKKTTKSLNIVEFDKMIYPLGSRKYFELSHLEEPIFIGKWAENNIVVPTESYIRHVLTSLDVVEGNCVAQINLTKNLKDFRMGERSKTNELRAEISYLDDDGIFYDEGSSKTKKIFIRGERQGIMNLKLDYLDGTSQFVQTFCSENTYLVEQL